MKSQVRTLLCLTLFGAAVSLHAGTPSQQIDALLVKDWQQHKLAANPPANDETLVRRLYLDIIGRIPTLQEAQSFLTSTDKDKRSKLIDQLLASDGYNQRMFHFWADLLRVQTRSNGGQGDMT